VGERRARGEARRPPGARSIRLGSYSPDPSQTKDGGEMTTETAGAVEVPTWQLDPTHSSVEFSVKHMMITTVRGRFKTISATLTGDEDSPEQPTAEATIDAASIDTGTPD